MHIRGGGDGGGMGVFMCIYVYKFRCLRESCGKLPVDLKEMYRMSVGRQG